MNYAWRIWFMKAMDAGPGYALCKLIGRLRHHLGQPERAANPVAATLRRLLIIRPGGLGDMIMLLPVLDALRRQLPHALLTVVCERRNREVLALAGMGDLALPFDEAPLRCLANLRREHYDVAIDTEQFHHSSAIMAILSGAPIRIGFKVSPARQHLYTHLIDYDMTGYEATQFSRLLTPILGTGAPPILPVAGFLRRPGMPPPTTLPDRLQLPDSRMVIVSPGSSNRYKHWDPAAFATVMHRLAGEQKDLHFALAGAGADLVQARALQALTGDLSVTDCTAQLSLSETAALIGQASLFIGCDSGLGHLATALGIPTLTLFGPSDARKWSHPGPNTQTIRKHLPCSPCASFGYYKLCRDIPCMRAITPASVHEAAMTLLGQSAAPKIL